MRYVLKVAYDGTDYCGWQIQKNGITVQQSLEEAIFTAFGQRCSVTASGRTDSGVHAEGQVCHVDIDTSVAGDKLADALNPRLPRDIAVLCSATAPQGFDANRSAKKKTYEYNFYVSPRRNPLKDRYSVWVKGYACGSEIGQSRKVRGTAVDTDKLREAAKCFVGVHDFRAYCASGSQVLTTVREIYSADVGVKAGNFFTDVKITLCGNGFLYNMVRTVAGTLLFYATGKISLADVVSSIETGNRALVGKTMPPEGLILRSVEYPFDLFGESHLS